MRYLKRIGFLLAVTAYSVGLTATSVNAEEFKLTYDLFRNLGTEQVSPADPDDEDQVRAGSGLYVEHCAECHGGALEGAENWQDATEDGTYLPPPHDDNGHTWHHSDKVLFEYTKFGGAELFKDYLNIVSAMPGFEDQLSDEEIWAILAYIKDSWSHEHRIFQQSASKLDPLPEAYLPSRLDTAK